jgi:hypothetical protein
MVVSIPAPRCDHRKHEDPALAKQALMGSWIVLANFFGPMGDVELDRSAPHVSRITLLVNLLLVEIRGEVCQPRRQRKLAGAETGTVQEVEVDLVVVDGAPAPTVSTPSSRRR